MKAIRIIGVLIILCSFIPLGPGVYFYNKTRRFLETSVQTEGTVVEMEERKNSEGNVTYYPVITFTDKTGREYKKYGPGRFPPKYEIGDRISLFYDPKAPKKIKLNSFTSLWLGPAIGGILGIIPLFAGLFFLLVLPIIIRRTMPACQRENNSPSETAYRQIDAALGERASIETKQSDKQSRIWSIFCHLSSFTGYVMIPFGNIIGPLVVWLIKKDEYPIVNIHAVESINFQISITIYTIISLFLCFILIGIVILPLITVSNIILVIVASIKANKGEVYRYPFTIRFIK